MSGGKAAEEALACYKKAWDLWVIYFFEFVTDHNHSGVEAEFPIVPS